MKKEYEMYVEVPITKKNIFKYKSDIKFASEDDSGNDVLVIDKIDKKLLGQYFYELEYVNGDMQGADFHKIYDNELELIQELGEKLKHYGDEGVYSKKVLACKNVFELFKELVINSSKHNVSKGNINYLSDYNFGVGVSDDSPYWKISVKNGYCTSTENNCFDDCFSVNIFTFCLN